MYRCAILASLLIAPLPAPAADYYVDSRTGSDGADGTSPASAWKTLDRVNRLDLEPGDTVHVRRGTNYTTDDFQTVLLFSAEDSGTADQPVTVKTYGEGKRPLLRQTFHHNRNSAIVGLSGGASHIVVEGLHMQGVLGEPEPTRGRNGIDVFSTALVMDGSTYSNVTIRDCELEGGTRGMLLYRCQNFLIEDNYIHDINGVNTNTRDWAPLAPAQHRGKTDPAFPLDPITKPNGADDDSGAEGIDLNTFCDNIKILRNRIDNIAYDSYDYGMDGTFLEIYEGNISNVEVAGNVISNVPGGTVEAGAWTGGVLSNFDFHHNVIVDGVNLFVIHCYRGQHAMTDLVGLRFNHNTFVQRAIDDDDKRPWTIFDINGTLSEPGKAEVRNNIFYLTTGTKNLWRGEPASNVSSVFGMDDAFTRTNNLYFHPSGAEGRFLFAMPLDPSERRDQDPGFVDLAGKDFRLAPSSPAIDAGADLGYAADILGNPVSCDAPDLGAYESQP